MTLRGKLDDPEFIFKFSGVSYPAIATTTASTTLADAPPARDSGQAPGVCLAYDLSGEKQDVQLKGTLESRIFPGRPNYENVAAGDAADNVWVLNLDSPICVAAGPPDPDMGGAHYPPPENGVGTMQVWFKHFDTFDEDYRGLLGQKVIATGSLGHAVHGSDHTPVLLHVTAINGPL